MSWCNLTWAKPGQGKTLDAARLALDLFDEYRKTEKKYPSLPRRILYSNIRFARDIEQRHGDHLYSWESPQELRWCYREHCWQGEEKHTLHDVDLVIDEIANYFPADGWKDMPRWLRKMFAQHRHRGIRIFANTQDYKAVDISFRRMVGTAYKLRKWFGSRDISATLPPPKHLFGVIIKRRFDPEQIEYEGSVSPNLEQEDEGLFGWPQWFFITKRLVSVYDTTQDLREWSPDQMEHREVKCVRADCDYTHVIHRPI